MLDPREVRVENRLAGFCKSPKCPHFGLSMSCPPHISGPGGMRKLLEKCSYVMVIRIEVDSDSLHGEDRPSVMRLLHEISATVEQEAIRLGFSEAYAFAGGSCKMSFCASHEQCAVLSGEGNCRNPDAARPSMSGFGVNVGALMQAAGWSTSLFTEKDDTGVSQSAWVAGLILLYR
ncbi:DUF2284 domain-containing protein [Desulfopila aestuarii]|nr:DUF2284 domain-containing protein [Desulfopila aestuarii]